MAKHSCCIALYRCFYTTVYCLMFCCVFGDAFSSRYNNGSNLRRKPLSRRRRQTSPRLSGALRRCSSPLHHHVTSVLTSASNREFLFLAFMLGTYHGCGYWQYDTTHNGEVISLVYLLYIYIICNNWGVGCLMITIIKIMHITLWSWCNIRFSLHEYCSQENSQEWYYCDICRNFEKY